MKNAAFGLILSAVALTACGHTPTTVALKGGWVSPPSASTCVAQADDGQEPPFIRNCFGNFDRASAIAIAYAEWRAWGQVVYDADPKDEGPVDPNTKAERQPGFWQRVGLYWWLGMNESNPTSAWTGQHDASGVVFSPDVDGSFAWSAAFISFVMRMAGAGPSFPYAESHSVYINAAVEESLNQSGQYAIQAEAPNAYAPVVGDLICFGRNGAAALTYAQLPAGRYTSHCGIVVAKAPDQISIIGGNVEDAVALTHVPVTDQGLLAEPDGTVLDTRYPWLLVIRIAYNQ
ncbi:DUF2272 domain-containing protein [Acidisoma cellulosilytica]|uniref:DUF2272 domain-containing protein n=1 Tax=Acidisoma cellulosilyticum TaxID=2802395 RepID=A0A964E3P6_9PROT|nr:DUF2272 domain-containing protein [Acidisoma cellulosilyticum]MCB8880457.1 DUF2272 domain-containing protein [Acidisoma cellulosilyticum]